VSPEIDLARHLATNGSLSYFWGPSCDILEFGFPESHELNSNSRVKVEGFCGEWVVSVALLEWHETYHCLIFCFASSPPGDGNRPADFPSTGSPRSSPTARAHAAGAASYRRSTTTLEKPLGIAPRCQSHFALSNAQAAQALYVLRRVEPMPVRSAAGHR
jgi:hypothetical protein